MQHHQGTRGKPTYVRSIRDADLKSRGGKMFAPNFQFGPTLLRYIYPLLITRQIDRRHPSGRSPAFFLSLPPLSSL
jgi:hypothetical protein